MTKLLTFEEAVDFVTEWLANRPPRSPLLDARSLEPGALQTASLQSDGYRRLFEDPERLVRDAVSDGNMYDALRFGIAKALHLGKPLPHPAHSWLVDHLQDRVERPKSKRGRKSHLGAHFWVYYLVEELVKRGLRPTRNDERNANSSTAEETACDAVAVALERSGDSIRTYKAVKKIWLDVRKHRNAEGLVEFPQLYPWL